MARGDETDSSTDRALTALVALLAADRDDRVIEGRTGERSEYVLEDAGLTYQEIAALTGKKTENVRGTLRRRKKS
jgi:DNA-directed RNA polymerase specialized sigma24 family protein